MATVTASATDDHVDVATAPSSRTFSRQELAFLIGVPAAWAILLLFHPVGQGNFSDLVGGKVTAWLVVHLGMAVFVPLFAAAVFLLLRDVRSTAATVSRIGLAVFAVVYAAWELLLGGGTGILALQVEALPEAQQALGGDLMNSYAESSIIVALSMVGGVGLAVAMIGAAVALRSAYRLGWAPILLMVLATPLIALHEPPFGPVGLALFIGAVLLVRAQSAMPAPSAPPLPLPEQKPGVVAPT